MNNTMEKVWGQVEYLLADNISLIPVRDKPQYNSKGEISRGIKTPYEDWTINTKRAFTKDELYASMERYQSMAVGLICGEVSGGIEAIDVDVKYKPGIDATLLKDIQTFYPDIFDRLRIHKTPSGGCHLLYRINNHVVPGSRKLAGRPATQQEINNQTIENELTGKKKIDKEYNFIETRGEAAYVLAPPSLNYSIVQDRPIPTLSWEERCSLISLCETYTELVKVIPPPKPAKAQEDQFSTNPFEDYNMNGELIPLLEEYGWNLLGENAERYMFTRPGKDTGVSATWHKDNRCFYVFTSSTEFEASRGYNPSTVLSILLFQGNKSKAFQHLTQSGFGIFKPFTEEKIVKRHALAKTDLPANISQAGRETYKTLIEKYESNLPFGQFWKYHFKTERFEISREDVYRVADEIGYRLFNKRQIVKATGQLIEKQDDKAFFNAMKTYIWEENNNTKTDILNSFEAFLQKSGAFTISRLTDLTAEDILKDTKNISYKCFSNGILAIEVNNVELLSYDNFDKYIWKDKILNREWIPEWQGNSSYVDFINNAIGITPYLKRVVGYLAHEYKSPSSGYLILLTEKTVDPKDGGGSGKNIFGNMFAGTTTIKTVPGATITFDDKFLSAWNNEKIYFLADMPKRLDWDKLKEPISGAGISNKKFIPTADVAAEDMPKLLMNTNYSYDDIDGGVRRRIRPVEFTTYYTINGPVDQITGKHFPSDFNADDWAGYDHFMVDSIQHLIKANGKIELIPLSNEGWIKKFHIRHHESTLEFIEDNIEKWCEQEKVPNDQFQNDYTEFCNQNNISLKYRKEKYNLTLALKDYCQHHSISLKPNEVERMEGYLKPVRCKIFGQFIDETY